VIGDDVALVVDTPGARGLWDVPTAIQRVRELEPFDLRWIEQPLPPADLEGHARLRAAVSVPIGTGEDEWSPETYGRVIDSNGVDVLQLDPGRCLGLTGCREVVKMAEAARIKCSAHSWSSALSTAASVSFLAISNACDACDFKPHDAPLKEDLVENPWRHEDGYFAVRDEPGLGMRVREEVVPDYLFE
jgi:L-alanine-DL-glutamate epimerase-like enolase superfamily enzyme